MKKMFSVIVFCFLVISSLSVISFGYSVEPNSEVLLVTLEDEKDVSIIREIGFEVLDIYGNFALIKGDADRSSALSGKGMKINDLENRKKIHVKGHDFNIEEGPSLPDELKIEGYQDHTKGMYLVHMLGPVNPEWRETLEKKDVQIVNYVPNYAYNVRMTPEKMREVKKMEFVDWIGPYHPGYKLEKGIEPGVVEVFIEDSLDDKGIRSISDHFMGSYTLTRKNTGYSKLKAKVPNMDSIENMAHNPEVYWISNYGSPILYDEIGTQVNGGYFNPDNTSASPYRGPGDHGSHANQLGYDGSGITIQVADTGLGDGTTPNAGHNDYTGRVAGGSDLGGTVDGWDDQYGHGTHCAGLAAGDTYNGNNITYAGWANFYLSQGSAPGSELWATQIFEGSSGDFPSTDYMIPEDGRQNGAYISSNSWGEMTGDSSYDTSDSDYDRAVRDADNSTSGDQSMSIFVAAGNNNGDNSIGSPGSAKNVITVASHNNYMPDSDTYGHSYGPVTGVNTISDFSNGGFENDGRIKPDVAATGSGDLATSTPTLSSSNLEGFYYDGSSDDTRYEWCSGTSMACPTAAGAGAVIADYYNSTYGTLPSPALIKALMINAAQDMDDSVGNTAAIPNKDEGWGRVFLPPIVDRSRYQSWVLEDRPTQMQTGDIDSYDIQVDNLNKPLNITMAYSDNEASGGDSVALKNDLHLTVTDPGGNVWYGNAFSGGMSVSGSGNINTNWDTNGDDNDDRNNVENVFIPSSSLQSGEYTVEVEAFNVPEDGIPETAATDQDYALAMYNANPAASNDAPAVNVTRPEGGEHLVSGNTETIRWNMSDPEEPNDNLTCDIYYSNDSGNSWGPVATGLNGTANPNTYDWTVPTDSSTRCLVKVNATDTNVTTLASGKTGSDVSNNTFTISPLAAPSITINEPNGGEVWYAGSDYSITWDTNSGNGSITGVTLEYTSDGGASWNEIVANTTDDGAYAWTVPDDDSTNCLVRGTVYDNNSLSDSDTSNSTFEIVGDPPASPGNLTVEHYGTSSNTTIETRYMRADDVLGTTQTSTPLSSTFTGTGDNPVDVGMRVYVYNGTAITSELTGGSAEAVVETSSTGLVSTTWTPPSTSINSTDSIRVEIYADIGTNPPTTLRSTFTTEQLGADQIDASQWTVYYYVSHSFSTGTTTGTFEWGSTSVNSRIVNFSYSTTGSGIGTSDNIVNWTASPDDGAGDNDITNYNIYRSDVNTGPWDSSNLYDSVAADGSSNYSYVDPGAGTADNTIWWYVVRAVDVDGLNDSNVNSVPEPAVYNLTINSTVGGNVTTPGEGNFTFDAGQTVDLEAVADPGHKFVRWKGDNGTIGDTTANATTIRIVDDHNITAVFAPVSNETYNLSISSTVGGTVIEPGEGNFTYNASETVNLEAVADPDHHFVEWTGDTASIIDPNSNATTIEMNGNYTIEAVFINDTYNLTVSSTAGGSVVLPGEGNYTYNASEVADLEAVADVDHHFVEWTGDIGTMADPTSNVTTITMDANYTVEAVFTNDTYNLTISSTAGGSVVVPGEGEYTYNASEFADLEAVSDSDHHFVEWTGDNATVADPTSNITTITMDANYTVEAVFTNDTYNLTISSTAGGSVVVPGEGNYTYNAGKVVNLEAVPNTGYHFVEWTGDNGTITDTNSNTTTITMDGNYNITANFASTDYNLTINSTTGGSVVEPGEGVFGYQSGETVNLEAAADQYYHFVRWTGDNATITDPSSNSTTITMDASYNITAEFALDTYTLTIASTLGGEVVQPGEGTYTYDATEVVDLEAVPDPGYHFVEWTGDNGTIADTTANATTITMNGDYVITAEFAATDYNLTVSSTMGGNVTSPGEGTFGYQSGETVNLEAMADKHYHFVRWSGGNTTVADPTSNSTTITMHDNYSITAEFAIDVYNLTINSTAGGSVAVPGEGNFTYNATEVVDLEAVPDTGYHFVEWTGDNATIANLTSNSTTITINGSYNITAHFALNSYTLTISSTSGGSVTVPGEGDFPYSHGEVVDLEGVADTGYQFVEWTGDNGTISDTKSNTTTITMEGDYTITAEFIATGFDLTISSTQGGSVTAPGEGTYSYDVGQTVDLEAVADANYHFVRWSGDNGTIADRTANMTTITMDGDYTITAEFAIETFTLTVQSTSGGEVTEPGEDSFEYEVGEEVTLTAEADQYYHFVQWTGDTETIADAQTAQTSITIEGDYTITAEFEIDTYTLTVASTAGGTVTEPGEDSFEYDAGEVVDLEAVADADYTFVGWTGDNGTVADTSSNVTTITIEEDTSITAKFSSVEAGFIEIISPKEGALINESTVTVEWNSENIDYHEVRIDGISWIDIGVNTTFTCENLEDDDHTIEVKGVYGENSTLLSAPSSLGTSSETDSVNFTVDTAAPTINIITPSDGDTFETDSVSTEWDGSDQVSGIDHYEVKLNNGEWQIVGDDPNHTFSDLQKSTHKVHVRAVDEAGNTAEDSVEFEVKASEAGPSGPLEGNILFGILAVVIAIIVALLMLLGWYRKGPEVVVSAPEDQIASERGTTYTYDFRVENLGKEDESYSIQLESLPSDWETNAPEEIYVIAEGEESIPVDVTVPEHVEPGDTLDMTLTATSLDDPDVSSSDMNKVTYEAIEGEEETSSEEDQIFEEIEVSDEETEVTEKETAEEPSEEKVSEGERLEALGLSSGVGAAISEGKEEIEGHEESEEVSEKSEKIEETEEEMVGSEEPEEPENPPERPEKPEEPIEPEEPSSSDTDSLEETPIGTDIASEEEEPEKRPEADITDVKETIRVGEEVEFSASGSTPMDSIISYEWYFDELRTKFGETVEQTFEEPGSHTIKLIVTDEKGSTDEAEMEIYIEEAEKKTDELTGEEDEERSKEMEPETEEDNKQSRENVEDTSEREEKPEKMNECSKEISMDEAIDDLTQLRGLGPLKAERLYKNGYRSIGDLKNASKEELKDIKGIGRALSEKIFESLEELEE